MKKNIVTFIMWFSMFFSVFLSGMVVGQNCDEINKITLPKSLHPTVLIGTCYNQLNNLNPFIDSDEVVIATEIESLTYSDIIKNDLLTNDTEIVKDDFGNIINNHNFINTDDINKSIIEQKEDVNIYEEQLEINLSDISNRSNLTTDEFNIIIDNILIEKNILNSPLKGQGEILVQIENEYNVNGLFVLSVASFETGYGSKGVASQNNLFGISKSGGGYQTYASAADSMLAFGHLIKTYYIDNGYTNIQSISIKYCEKSDHWITNVSWFMNSLYGAEANKILS